MSAYVIAIIEVTDAEVYEAYKPLALASLAPYGGRYLVRGGGHRPAEMTASAYAGADGAAIVVSERINRVVIAEFPTMQAVEAWYDGPEYRAARAARAGAAEMTVIFVDGIAPAVGEGADRGG